MIGSSLGPASAVKRAIASPIFSSPSVSRACCLCARNLCAESGDVEQNRWYSPPPPAAAAPLPPPPPSPRLTHIAPAPAPLPRISTPVPPHPLPLSVLTAPP